MRTKSKKGEGTSDLYLIIFYVICFGALFLMSIRYVGSVAFGDVFERTYIARDFALVMGMAYASPGRLEYTYPINLLEKKFEMTAGNGSVEVSGKSLSKVLTSKYEYAISENITDEKVMTNRQIKIIKDENKIEKYALGSTADSGGTAK